MNRPLLVFFVVVLAIVIAIARYNSKKPELMQAARPSPSPSIAANSSLLIPPPAGSPAASATPSPVVAQNTPAPDFKKSASRVAPSIVTLSVFDGPGRLLRNGIGFFVSADGKVATSRSVINEGGHAVAKTADGKIYNVDGILMQDAAADVAIVQVEVKGDVPFVALDKAAGFNPSKSVALVSGSGEHQGENVSVSNLGPHQSKTVGDWSELAVEVPPDSLGAPVINEKGDIVGLATLERGEEATLTVVRATSSLNPLLAHIDKHTKAAWMVASADVPPPAEGPSPKPKVSPPPAAFPPGTKKLVFAPRPKYPNDARRMPFQSRGSGRYRVSFGSDGTVRSVQVIESTHSQLLDVAAVSTLRTWKAAPGTEWSAEVPLSFSP